MSPIPGIVASQITGHLATNSYESIQSTVIGTAVNTFTFSSIPQTYKHLEIRYTVRGDRAVTYDTWIMWYNGVQNGNYYDAHVMYGGGTGSAISGGSYSEYGQNQMSMGLITEANASSNMFGSGVINIFDYTSSKLKVTKCISGIAIGSAAGNYTMSGLFNQTGAITSITLQHPTGGGLQPNSIISLYGIKG